MTFYLPFLLASLVIILIPGPAVLFVVARSLEQGVKAGLISVAGVSLGGFVHVGLVSLGISALLATSPVAFTAIRFAGAAYLIYLGIRKLLEKKSQGPIPHPKKEPLARLFRQGFVVQLLNPKVALFFLSFLPQFINPQWGHIPLQLAALGSIFVVLAFLSDGAYAVLAGQLGRKFLSSTAHSSLGRWISGLIYVGLGLFTAWGEWAGS